MAIKIHRSDDIFKATHNHFKYAPILYFVDRCRFVHFMLFCLARWIFLSFQMAKTNDRTWSAVRKHLFHTIKMKNEPHSPTATSTDTEIVAIVMSVIVYDARILWRISVRLSVSLPECPAWIYLYKNMPK